MFFNGSSPVCCLGFRLEAAAPLPEYFGPYDGFSVRLLLPTRSNNGR